MFREQRFESIFPFHKCYPLLSFTCTPHLHIDRGTQKVRTKHIFPRRSCEELCILALVMRLGKLCCNKSSPSLAQPITGPIGAYELKRKVQVIVPVHKHHVWYNAAECSFVCRCAVFRNSLWVKNMPIRSFIDGTDWWDRMLTLDWTIRWAVLKWTALALRALSNRIIGRIF